MLPLRLTVLSRDYGRTVSVRAEHPKLRGGEDPKFPESSDFGAVFPAGRASRSWLATAEAGTSRIFWAGMGGFVAQKAPDTRGPW